MRLLLLFESLAVVCVMCVCNELIQVKSTIRFSHISSQSPLIDLNHSP